jgi:hypothetical protein
MFFRFRGFPSIGRNENRSRYDIGNESDLRVCLNFLWNAATDDSNECATTSGVY